MKTSIIVSGIAALCLMITFAEAPRRHGEKNMNVNPNNNISFVTVNMANMLPGVEVTANRSKKADIAASQEDFSYLKFNLGNFEKATTENESMPEASEADFNYLKFDANKYFEINTNTEPEDLPASSENDFSYLKFDAGKYINNSEPSDIEVTQNALAEPSVNEFEYLKFNAGNFTGTADMNTAEELPENEYSNLKFDVNKFYNSNLLNDNDNDISDLPATEE